MALGISDQIRAMARTKYVNPAIGAGKTHFAIRVRDLLADLKISNERFPEGHIPQICSALQTAKFLHENGLEIEEVEGPPSKLSTTVVVRYRVSDRGNASGSADVESAQPAEVGKETPEEWAHRLTEKLNGLLKEELKEYGGAEGFIRWVRGYDEDDVR
jgi:hypothetical protein